MLCCLLAYDGSGNVIDRLDQMVALNDNREVIGLIDFAAHEEAGGEATDIWLHSEAVGAKVWPEWLGSPVRAFRVELVGPPGQKRIAALIHKTSGHRRERAAIEAAIAAAPTITLEDGTQAKDIRSIVGGPDRPLILDDEGRTVGRSVSQGTPAHIPLIGRQQPPNK